ncbi:MAG TPA: hypothetical protein VGP82_11610 [Ktedonobacterales bacterium]|nr:hypothetical protein [Ktedonobacterales bacterium]
MLQRAPPLSAHAGRWLAAACRGVAWRAAAVRFFVNIERNHARYLRVIVFLAIRVGLGLFALSYDASL